MARGDDSDNRPQVDPPSENHRDRGHGHTQPTRRVVARQRRAIRRRRITVGTVTLLAVLTIILVNCTGGSTGPTSRLATGKNQSKSQSTSSSKHHVLTAANWTPEAWIASLEAKVKGQPGHLQPGSNPSVLPGPILIADRNNSRLLIVDPKGRILWQFPSAGSLAPGQTFLSPDDAFLGPTGTNILATQESQFAITLISLKTGHITWRYGHPGVAGSGPGYLDNPDDAMLLPNGNVISADIKNCRLLYLSPKDPAPVHIYGETTPYCYHNPPARFGSPNGMFPMTNGNWLVTEINGDWVDEMTPTGTILWSVHPPGISYPSDTNQVSSNVFLTAAYTKPGVVEEFNSSGQLLWRFAPTGANALDEPSLALPLPNGDVMVNDDWNDRVIVIDPKTNQIVWQYGVTGVPGAAPGYLYKPDGMDLTPPNSLLMTHASTIGIPPYPVPGTSTSGTSTSGTSTSGTSTSGTSTSGTSTSGTSTSGT